ncbi:MAG: RNA methyltransferase [Syntrophaceae bacterium]|nr:RNA methyltransferase [Syntrophaceae bacterium]
MQRNYSQASLNQIKRWTRLLDAKFRREDGLFLAEGGKVVRELLAGDWQTEALLVLPEKASHWEKAVAPVQDRIPVYFLARPEFKKLSQDKEPDGVIAVVRKKEPPDVSSWLAAAAGPLLVGHGITNPQNLGALIRSACWFGFAGVILSANSVDWTHPKVVRSSMGGVFKITVLAGVDLWSLLPDLREKFLLVGSDVREGAVPHPVEEKAALLVGSESHGLPESLLQGAAVRWRIPGGAGAESLSLPQAAAIMMYEMRRGRMVDGG